MHLKTIHSKISQCHKCEECKKEFGNAEKLKRHIKNVHEGIRYQCVSCDKSFTNSRNLARHPKKTSHEKVN